MPLSVLLGGEGSFRISGFIILANYFAMVDEQNEKNE
jgi:hypothetical protein